ncbi:hypothetical protein BJY04DRAFT_175301 [Aspergillus karnatakaensis]|uniref:uncharacterized protein n=1 Tax=Aspergillus karnatakaensis TaxID=1810916 RepID=UPI003CCD34FD
MTTPGTDCPASSSPSCNFTCPAGGTWYTCQDPPYFVGCCSSDPCTNVSPRSTSPCPDGGLYPASFNPAIFNSFLPNTCIGEENANWFTCNFTTPPFLGCCLTNPCANGSCPQSDLVQAAWTAEGGGVDQFVLFRDEGSSSNDTTGDDGDDSGGDSGGLSAGAIAGIVVGVVALIAVLLALWWFLRRKKKAGRAGGGGGGDGSVAAWHERSASQQQQQQFLATGYQGLSPLLTPLILTFIS